MRKLKQAQPAAQVSAGEHDVRGAPLGLLSNIGSGYNPARGTFTAMVLSLWCIWGLESVSSSSCMPTMCSTMTATTTTPSVASCSSLCKRPLQPFCESFGVDVQGQECPTSWSRSTSRPRTDPKSTARGVARKWKKYIYKKCKKIK